MSKLTDDIDRIIDAHEERIALREKKRREAIAEQEKYLEEITARFTEIVEEVILPAMHDARTHLLKRGLACEIVESFDSHAVTGGKRYKEICFRASTKSGADLRYGRESMDSPTLVASMLINRRKFEVRYLKVSTQPEYCEIGLDDMTDDVIAAQIGTFLSRMFKEKAQ